MTRRKIEYWVIPQGQRALLGVLGNLGYLRVGAFYCIPSSVWSYAERGTEGESSWTAGMFAWTR
jgi:hypothetical protein